MINKTALRYYVKTGVFGLGISLVFFVWSLALGLAINTSINRALANASFIMIGLSYVIGPLAIDHRWFASKLYYRKHLGVLGLFAGILHTIISLRIFSLSGLLKDFDALFFGTLSLVIFSILLIISDKRILKRLGPQTWRRLQSWGYYGLLFAMVQVFIKSWKKWSWWLQNPLSLPPTSLFTAVFWFGTFFIRTYFYTYRGGKKHITEK